MLFAVLILVFVQIVIVMAFVARIGTREWNNVRISRLWFFAAVSAGVVGLILYNVDGFIYGFFIAFHLIVSFQIWRIIEYLIDRRRTNIAESEE